MPAVSLLSTSLHLRYHVSTFYIQGSFDCLHLFDHNLYWWFFTSVCQARRLRSCAVIMVPFVTELTFTFSLWNRWSQLCALLGKTSTCDLMAGQMSELQMSKTCSCKIFIYRSLYIRSLYMYINVYNIINKHTNLNNIFFIANEFLHLTSESNTLIYGSYVPEMYF